MSSFDNSFLNEKLDHLLKQLKCAAKVNLVFGFALRNIEYGTCRHFNANENNTVMERSKLVYIGDDMTKLKEKLQKMNIVDHGTRKRANTKRKIYKLTNVTVFASLLKDTPMGCKDTVLPEPLLKIHNANCFTFERNTTQPYNDKLFFFRALSLHLHGNSKLEEENANFFIFSLRARKEISQFSNKRYSKS